jgi:hypothetical protein
MNFELITEYEYILHEMSALVYLSHYIDLYIHLL